MTSGSDMTVARVLRALVIIAAVLVATWVVVFVVVALLTSGHTGP